MSKQALYEAFITRLETAIADTKYFEASWYAYAVLEDRLMSMMRNSGGAGRGGGGKPIHMMGPKLTELTFRAKTDPLLKANFEFTRLKKWTNERNNLMHAMADSSMALAEIDAGAKALAEEGAALVREYSAACRRLKRHRARVAAQLLAQA